MKRIAALVFASLILVACASDGDSNSARVSSSLVGEGTAVQVLVTSLPRGTELLAARLIGPNGQRVETRSIDDVSLTSEPARGGGVRPSVGVGVMGGSRGGVSTGVGLGLDFFNLGGGGGRTLDRRAVTQIPLTDPEAYAQAPENWRIEVDLRDEDDRITTRSFAAPTS